MNSGGGGGWQDEWDRRAWSREGATGPASPQQHPPYDQRWGQPSGYPPPGYDWAADPEPRSGAGVAIGVVAVVLLVIAVLVAVVVLVVMSGGDDGDGAPVAGEDWVTVTSTAVPADREASPSETPTRSTPTTTRASSPSGLVEECVDEGDTELPRAGRGTVETSCPFAIAVREAYLSTARPGDPASVEAHSPVTGQTYTMGCLGGDVVTCRGGNNAVVHLY